MSLFKIKYVKNTNNEILKDEKKVTDFRLISLNREKETYRGIMEKRIKTITL